MNIQLFLLFGAIFCLSKHVAASTEALLECGRIHHVDTIQNHSTATASYSNSRCMLLCGFGKTILPVDSIHEGRSCPDDANGICSDGKCVGGQEDALRECGLKHGVDFHQVDNHQGTAFTNDQCVLKCVVGGDQLSATYLHEGSPCPANSNGVCHAGICVSQSTNPGTIVTNTPPTTPTPPPITTPTLPTTVSKPSIESFSPLKMKLLNISLEFADPSLRRDQEIDVIYDVHQNPTNTDWHTMCIIYGDSSKQNDYYAETINDMPRRLNRTSLMSIDLYRNDNLYLAEHYENLYTLFANFYHNHQLPFGQEENFVANFSLNSRVNHAEKLMDVGIRFTILFSEN